MYGCIGKGQVSFVHDFRLASLLWNVANYSHTQVPHRPVPGALIIEVFLPGPPVAIS